MAVQAEKLCFENMDLSPFPFYGSVLGIENAFSQPSSSSLQLPGSLPVEFVQFLYSDFQNQSLEMDWFLQLQSQRLRSILQEETRKQIILLQKYESRIQTLIFQKDGEITSARNRTIELENLCKRAETEAKIWKKKAIESETTVYDLNRRLNDDDDDAVSFCDSSSVAGEGKRIEEDRRKRMSCKLCHSRNSSVVLFPCRHLCCCKFCEPICGQCPVCETVKENSLEVYLV